MLNDENELERTDTMTTNGTHDDAYDRAAGPSSSARQGQQKKINYTDYYYHPARGAPQRTIWIPRDNLGLGEYEVKVNREDYKISASCENASMDNKGRVKVGDGGPPGNDVEAEETA